jgi:hypothetical protein
MDVQHLGAIASCPMSAPAFAMAALTEKYAMTPLALTLRSFRGICDGLGRDTITIDFQPGVGQAQLIALVGPNGRMETYQRCVEGILGSRETLFCAAPPGLLRLENQQSGFCGLSVRLT